MTARPLHFQDFKFEHTFARSSESAPYEWVPCGMPRLGYEVQTTVFYLFGKNPRTAELSSEPAGTGVFVSRQGVNTVHLYAVTAYHVAVRPYGISNIRVNTIVRGDDGDRYMSSRLLEFDPSQWLFIPDGDDLAAIDVTDEKMWGEDKRWGSPDIPEPFDLIAPVAEEDFVTQEFINAVEFGEGEDGFMLGLFSHNPGVGTNDPAFRFGNVAQLAHDQVPVEQGHHIERPSHVFDIRSRPGYSGSPVFVYRTPDHDLTAIPQFDENGTYVRVIRPDNMFVRLFGIHSGQFQDEITAQKKAEAYGQIPIHEGDKLVVPSSMTIVVPAWRITELLNLPQFEEQRKMREERIAKEKKGKPIVRPEAAQADASDGNHEHKADFMRLLNAAATTKPQDGQT